MEANMSPTPDEFTILRSSPVDISGLEATEQYVNRNNPHYLKFSVLPRRKKSGPVHMELSQNENEELLLLMIIQNDSLFSLVQSKSFGDFVYFLRDDAPKISRATMKRRLNVMYETEFQTVMEKL